MFGRSDCAIALLATVMLTDTVRLNRIGDLITTIASAERKFLVIWVHECLSIWTGYQAMSITIN